MHGYYLDFFCMIVFMYLLSCQYYYSQVIVNIAIVTRFWFFTLGSSSGGQWSGAQQSHLGLDQAQKLAVVQRV